MRERGAARSLFAALAFGSAILPCTSIRAERANPLVMRMPDGTPVENCADPTVLEGQGGNDTGWTLVCTQDALFDGDASHRLPIFHSEDLVHWTYAGDALAAHPLWAQPGAYLWAPELDYFRGKYHLYYAVTATKDAISGEPGCGWDAAIGVATSGSPAGPHTDSGTPVVFPRRSGTGCDFYLTIDPDVIVDQGNQKRIYYGNFNGGIETRELSADGLTSAPETAVPLVVADHGTEGAPSEWRPVHGRRWLTSNIFAPDALTTQGRRWTRFLWTGAGSEVWDDYTLSVTVGTDDDDGLGVVFPSLSGDFYKFDRDSQRAFRKLFRQIGVQEGCGVPWEVEEVALDDDAVRWRIAPFADEYEVVRGSLSALPSGVERRPDPGASCP